MTGADNSLVPNRPQAIISNSEDPNQQHIYAALGGDELKSICSTDAVTTDTENPLGTFLSIYEAVNIYFDESNMNCNSPFQLAPGGTTRYSS